MQRIQIVLLPLCQRICIIINFQIKGRGILFKYCSLEFKLTEVTERFFSLNGFFAKSAKANKDKDAKEFGIKNMDELLKECRNYQKYNS